MSSRPKSTYALFFFSDVPKFEVYCRKVPSECSIHHELYYQISSYPDCKTKDLLPSLLLRVELLGEMTAEWSDAIDINNQGTQVSEPRMSLPRPHGTFSFLGVRWLSTSKHRFRNAEQLISVCGVHASIFDILIML